MKTHRMILFAVLLMVVGRTMADNLRVETVNMSAGGTKQIAVVLNNPTHQYTAFQLDLALPDGVSIAKNNNGKFIVDLAEDRKDDHTLNVSEIGTNTYRFLAFSMTNTEFYGTDGALFYITLQASNDICGGNKTATIQSQVFTEVSGEQYKWNNETFQILIEEVTVTAKSYTREYGDANPVFEFTSEGADLEGSPEIICEATATSPVGEYPIIIKKGSVTNYNDTYVNGTLTITKAPLTIKAGTYTKKQGEVNPEFTLGYDGFKNNETNIVLTKQPIVRCDAVDSSAPGEYAVTVTGAEALNYNINYTNGKLIVVNADALVVVAKSYTREYGDANPTFEFTSEGAAIEGSPEITCEATATSPVGTYPIIIKKGSVTNYNDTYVNGTLTITKAPLTIKAGTYTKKQGEVNPEFTLSYVGFKNNETSEVLTKQSIVSCDAVDSSAPGEYAVTVTGAEALNYDINYTNGKLIVVNADALVVTANSYTRKYGDANPKFEFTSEGATLNGTPEIICEATTASPVGTYPIIIKKGSVTNYNDTYVNGTLTITKAPLAVSVGNYSKKQGEANPEFVITYEGFKNNETSDVLSKEPSVATTATVSSAPGDYDIVVSGGEATNYDITYTNGKLTITNADPVTITAKSYTREYGDANPKFEFTSEGATLNGTPEITCEATTTSPVGTYPIVIRKGSVTNYNDTYVNGTLTITKAPLTVSIGNYTKKQGEDNPEFVITYEGFKNNETSDVLSKKPSVATTATVSSAPGDYDIVVSGGEANNYDITYKNGKLTITNADPVTITAKSYTREYGDANPTFEFTSEGADLEGSPEIICEATATSPVGEYPIIIKKGSVTNYNDTYVNGTLTITKAPLTIKAGTYTKKQGAANPKFILSYEGFKNNETQEVLTKQPTAICEATGSSAPGEYAVTITGAEALNYDINYTNGKLIVVNADALVVVAKSYTREYGDANPTFEYTTEGATMDGTPEIICEATAASPVGEYPIIIKKGSVTNYNDTYVNGVLTITKAPLTITAKDYTIKWGDELPVFEAVYEGLKNNETPQVALTSFSISSGATSMSDEGTYDIVVTATSGNYELTLVQGTLTITEPDSHTLLYMVDGEVYKSYSVKYGSAITPESEPTKEGYTFSGWSEIPATMPNQDVTVTGSFTINKYTLTYMVDGEVYKTYEVEYGSEIVPEAAPEKEGYTFSGWSEIPEIMPANDVVVTGTFTINKYTLTYMVDGEVYKTYEVEYGSEIEPEAAPEKEGYSFSGWSKIPETMPANDVVVTGTFTWVDAIPGIITYQCEYQIFTPDGRLVNKLQKGLNIIRLSNGLMKKLMVK